MFAYIVNYHSRPLMLCSPRKARLLLKRGKAKVIKMAPFTLQLRYGTRIHASANCKHLTIVQKAHACLVERRGGIPPMAEPVGGVPSKS
jgi:hypothetical protein